jgi:hypothetical protein
MHTFITITKVKTNGHRLLDITYSDGKQNTVDLTPFFSMELYRPLQNQSEFKKVYIDKETGTIMWPCGADFDPDTLYNWDIYQKEFTNR